jgi:hypothetical protein
MMFVRIQCLCWVAAEFVDFDLDSINLSSHTAAWPAANDCIVCERLKAVGVEYIGYCGQTYMPSFPGIGCRFGFRRIYLSSRLGASAPRALARPEVHQC